MKIKFYSATTLALLAAMSACVFEKQLDPVAKLEPPSYVTVLKNPQSIPSNARWYMPDIYYYISDDVKSYASAVNQAFKEYNDAGSLRFYPTSRKDSADIFIEFADLGKVVPKTTGGLVPQPVESYEGFQLANYTVEIGEIDFPELFRATIQLNKNFGDRWNQNVVKSTLLYQIGKIMGLFDSNSPASALQNQVNISQPITSLSLDDKSRFKGIYDVRETGKWEAKTFSLPLNIIPGNDGRVPNHYMSSLYVGDQFYLVYSPTSSPTESSLYKYDAITNQFSLIVSTNGNPVFAINNLIYSYDGTNLFLLNGNQWNKQSTYQPRNGGALFFKSRYSITRSNYFSVNNNLYYFPFYDYFYSKQFEIVEMNPFTGSNTSYSPPLYVLPFQGDEEIKPFGKYMLTFVNGNYFLIDINLKTQELIGVNLREKRAEYPSILLFGLKNRIYFTSRLNHVGKFSMGHSYEVYNPFNRRRYSSSIRGKEPLALANPDELLFNLYQKIYNGDFDVPAFYNFSTNKNAFIIRSATNDSRYPNIQSAGNYFLTFTPHKTFSK